MFISDAMYHLRRTLEGKLCEVLELEAYFRPMLSADLPDVASRYLGAAACFLLLQVSMWEQVVVAVDDPVLAEFILSQNHALSGLETRPLPATLGAMKLPTAAGRLRLELRGTEPAAAFEVDRAPSAFLFAIVSGITQAQAALGAWTARSAPSVNLALLVKAPLSEFEPMLSTISSVDHRIGGWLNIPEADGLTNIVALVVLGANRDEI